MLIKWKIWLKECWRHMTYYSLFPMVKPFQSRIPYLIIESCSIKQIRRAWPHHLNDRYLLYGQQKQKKIFFESIFGKNCFKKQKTANRWNFVFNWTIIRWLEYWCDIIKLYKTPTSVDRETTHGLRRANRERQMNGESVMKNIFFFFFFSLKTRIPEKLILRIGQINRIIIHVPSVNENNMFVQQMFITMNSLFASVLFVLRHWVFGLD